MPAYVIFHDATLREIATRRPTSLAELGRINGIGEAKLARHGQAVLDTLAEVSPSTGQARIRVPFGSYSAPGATSASTHSPSTATAGGPAASTGR